MVKMWIPLLSRWRDSRRRSGASRDRVVTMTRGQLESWAAERGMVVVDTAEHEAMCARAAAAIAAAADLDRDYEVICGHAA